MVLDLNKVFALFLTLAGLSGTSCVIGCNKDMTVQEKLYLAEKIVEIGERHNVAYRVDIESNGFPRFEAGSYAGANTGVTIKAGMQGNAANSRLDPTPKPFNPIPEAPPTSTGTMTKVTETN